MDAEAWNQRYAASGLVWGDGPNVFVAAETEHLTPGTVLDLACGEGRNAVWLAGRGWRVTGVDFSSVALEKARQLAAAQGVEYLVTWVEADVTRWGPPPEAWDLVVVAYLQVAGPLLESALVVAARAVAPDGTLVVVGHDLAYLHGGVGGPQDPDVLYRPEGLRRIVRQTGLAVQRAEIVHRPTADGDAIDALCVARAAPVD